MLVEVVINRGKKEDNPLVGRRSVGVPAPPNNSVDRKGDRTKSNVVRSRYVSIRGGSCESPAKTSALQYTDALQVSDTRRIVKVYRLTLAANVARAVSG